MKWNNLEPSFEGMLEVYQMVMDGIIFFCNAFDLTKNQAFIILTICSYGELTLKELCEYVDCPKSTASRLVDDLVERKMLERVIPQENRRTVKISVNNKFYQKMKKKNQGPELQKALSRKMSQEEGMRAVGNLMLQRDLMKGTKK